MARIKPAPADCPPMRPCWASESASAPHNSASSGNSAACKASFGRISGVRRSCVPAGYSSCSAMRQRADALPRRRGPMVLLPSCRPIDESGFAKIGDTVTLERVLDFREQCLLHIGKQRFLHFQELGRTVALEIIDNFRDGLLEGFVHLCRAAPAGID